MITLIVSLSATLGSEVITGKDGVIAVIYDVVCNKDTGKLTYFILCPQSLEDREDAPAEYFAIHHSYFYFEGDNQTVTYNPKLGNDEHNFFLDLPQQYDEMEVQDLADFNRYVSAHSTAAGHRSDNN